MNLHRTVHPILAALLAAAPCATTAWAGPKGAGIDLEGMDRSVAPGDDFFAHANGDMAEDDRDPAPIAGPTARAVIVSDRTDERTARAHPGGREARARPAGSDARKIGDYYASYMDEAGIEAKGLAPLQPDARPHRAPSTAARPSPAPWAARCAPTWTRSTTRTSTRTTSSASGSPRTSTTRALRARSCCRAGSTCPTAPTTWTRRRAWSEICASSRSTWRPS